MKVLKKNRRNKKLVDEGNKPTDAAQLSKDLNKNIAQIKSEFGNCSDLSINLSHVNDNQDLRYASIYIDTLVSKNSINSLSLEMVEIGKLHDKEHNTKSNNYYDTLRNELLGFRDSNEGLDYNTLYNHLLSGYIIFLVDGSDKFLAIGIFEVEGRSVEQPSSQRVIRGPKEGFVETIDVNISMVRKRIKSKELRVEFLTMGSITKTKVALLFMDKIAKNDIIHEIKSKLSKLEIDGILESGYIEELLKDDKYSVFPVFFNSERPDSVTAALLEGKVAIIVDGTPFVLTAPAFFIEFFQASEDYYDNYAVASMIRILRIIAFFLTLLVPSIYVAIATFHQEAIPTPLLISISAQREGVPFPSFVEALLMESIFEILKEAGARMPRIVGPAISIVGALVLGQAAVEAGIISEVMVIIVSLTAISSFAIPNYSMANAVRIIRFPMLILAGTFGFYGITMGLITMVLYLCKMKSFGIPYLTPIAPKIKGGNKDTIFRAPLWKMKDRPVSTSKVNKSRVDIDNFMNSEQRGKQEFK